MRLEGARLLEHVVLRMREQIVAAGSPPVCIGTLLVSDDPRDASNATRKHRAAVQCGMQFRHVQLGSAATQTEVEAAVDELGRDENVHGVFVQLPLPAHLDAFAVGDRIPPHKDIDGLGAPSLGALARGSAAHAPATPAGIVRLLQLYGIAASNARVAVVGTSVEIARATALLYVAEGARSVALLDPDAPEFPAMTREAEIVVAAAERAAFLRGEFVREGAIVVDAGYNRTASGVAGDVDLHSVLPRARAVVPMPGGIGPATIAMLLERTWGAARASARA